MPEEEPEEVDAAAVEDGPAPELAPAVDEFLPGAMTVADPGDKQELMVVMDNHDTEMLLAQVQSAALRKWVYQLPGGKGTGLTVHAVQDIVQRMNWTRKCQIGALPDTLTVEEIVQDGEPYWVATIFARDELSGMSLPGTSMEPQRMHLKSATAQEKREQGAIIPENNTVFDRHSRTKAIAKATRNAMAGFIPEEIEQTVIAMFEGDSSRVERIQTEREAEAERLPPPLDDDEMKALIAEADAVYDELREAGGGQGKVKLPPGAYNANKLRVQHSHDRMRDFIVYLRERLTQIPGEVAREAREREAAETVRDIPCPKCEAQRFKYCKGVKGAHRERYAARLAQIEAAA